ncbi:hypothetical protein [Sphingomonas sp.]|uniref:hypothetical protein n=1 Tax=Sphingomonas sp. TaxID=28214 RepID=UPI001B139DF3|nr:hypothetical protein [Sphingomonas sp.]MBO9713882.1 hypothetical protein [Sphingomonas sp.]
MSYWAAAERVRSGEAGDAAPRPLSRFEGESDEAGGFDVEEADFVAPLPVPRTPGREPDEAHRLADVDRPPPQVAEKQTKVEPIELPTIAPDEAAPPPVATRPIAPEAIEAPPVATPPTVPAPSEQAMRVTELPVLPPPPVEAAPLRPMVSPVEAAPPVAPTLAIAAEPVAAALPPVTAAPLEVVAQPRVPQPVSVPSAEPPRAEGVAPEPLHIHIDRIEIRIDAPTAPALAGQTQRRAPAPVDLNDYLARRSR